jgi:uncharacterized protein (TIGR02466 family)
MIKNLFEVPFYEAELAIDCMQIYDWVNEYKEINPSVNNSNRGGYHSPDLEGEIPKLNILLKEFERHANRFAESLNSKPLVLGNVWFNENGYMNYNDYHIHSGCVLSGVWYLATPEDCGNLIFYHPRRELLSVDWNNTSMNGYNTMNSYSYSLKPSVNRLVLFPSWLEHSVEPNLNPTKKRISFSFNFIPAQGTQSYT